MTSHNVLYLTVTPYNICIIEASEMQGCIMLSPHPKNYIKSNKTKQANKVPILTSSKQLQPQIAHVAELRRKKRETMMTVWHRSCLFYLLS